MLFDSNQVTFEPEICKEAEGEPWGCLGEEGRGMRNVGE